MNTNPQSNKPNDQANPPQVAVVVTTYNRVEYLLQTLASVVNQDFQEPFELVIVDDGSTDDTKSQVLKFADQHNSDNLSIRYVHQPNAGLATARNTGVANSTAPFICFVDDDDLCEPKKLQLQVQAMRNDPDAGLCHTSFRYIDKHGEFIDDGPRRLDNPCVGHCVDVLLDELLVISSTVMVRRSTLEQAAHAEPHGLPYDPVWERSQDYDMALRMSRISRFIYLTEPLLRYRFHEGNIAMSKGNIKRAYGYHSRVQMDFVKRYGHEIGVDETSVKKRVAAFLINRADSHFWQRQLDMTLQLCDLADELGVSDDRFSELRSKASQPAWLYNVKDRFDKLIGKG